MKGHRTCIVCLPRTGSQLCEHIISEVNNAYKLGEFFENWNDSSQYQLDIDSNIYLKEMVHQSSPFKLVNSIEEKITLLKRVNPNQALTIRMFLMDHYNKLELSNIFEELKKIDFEFVTLERDLKNQLLSYMIARTHSIFGINNQIKEPIIINIGKLYPTLKQICNSSTNWGNNIDVVLNNSNYKKIKYETIYSDLENIYNYPFTYSGVKTIKGDPFDLIINKKEVVFFLNFLLK